MNDVQYTFFKNIIFNIQNSIELIELDHKSFLNKATPTMHYYIWLCTAIIFGYVQPNIL